MKAYDDKNYEDPKLLEDFNNYKRKVNLHAATLVIICAIKLFDMLIKPIQEIFSCKRN